MANRAQKAAQPASMGRIATMFAITALAMCALLLIAVNAGTLKVSPSELFNGLFIAYDPNVAAIYDLRFPRIFIALAGGAALAVSGVLLQAAIRNPLADPGIIGISSGAGFTALVVVAFFPSLFFLSPLFAFLGGLVAFALVFSLSWNGTLSPLRIILVGIAVSTLFTGLSAIFETGQDGASSSVTSIINANITLKTWDDLWTILAWSIPGLAASFLVWRRCDLLMLEDKTARSLGLNVHRNRLGISALAVLLASIATAVIGPISFLGLVVPHIARLLVGTGHKALIPYSMLLGAFCLLAADTIGRMVMAPYEISAAVVMAVIGGPAFIVLLRRARDSYGA